MTDFRKSLLEWRTAPAAIFVIAILMLVGGLAIIVQNESAFRASRNQQALVAAEVLAQSVAAAVDFDDPAASQQAVNAFRVNPQVRYVGVFDRTGKELAAYDPSHRRPADLARLYPVPGNSFRVSVPITSAQQRIGTVVYEVEREAVSRRLTRYVVVGLLAVMAALVIVTLGLAQTALHRVNRELSERAEALAQSNELLAEQIEERTKAEEQLRQSQKMQALGQLTGGIAHDFNNLLTVIQGSADILSRDELADERRKRFAKAIVQAAENAAVLTSQLLAFARRQPLKPEPVDLSELVASMTELLDRTMGERIRIETNLDRSTPPVRVDRNQLQSAILNVASNARDAMPDGGTLKIAVSPVSSGSGESSAAISISDTGVGMDPDTASRIFEPFFTTKKTGQGTGLGLSQVYGFATQSGGDVVVESEADRGTTITVLLPCSEPGTIAQGKAAEPEIAHQPHAEILVVEDNEEVGHFAQTLLSELGHSVTLATSGEEALELTRARDFDVVFSDVVMPGMGGLRLAEQLAEEKPKLPVILATGYSQEIAQSGSGGRPVLLKPYRLATLSQALVDAMGANAP